MTTGLPGRAVWLGNPAGQPGSSVAGLREDASGDSEDDELPCVIGESADGAHRTLRMINLVKFFGTLVIEPDLLWFEK